MKSFIQQLQNLDGDARFDPLSKKIYSVDASIFEIEPLGIFLPKNKTALLEALQLAAKHQVPVIARGAATGITGGCLGKGLIIDLSRFLNQILEINIDKEYAICQPGVVQDRLNETLSPFGYRLGPDTSTGNRATLGGMLANNAAGARSLYYGRMVDCVESVELALAGGQLIKCAPLDDQQFLVKQHQSNPEGRIYKEVERIRHQYAPEIDRRFPKIPRHVSGYNLDQLIGSSPYNLAKLIAGSEGTLGIATEIKVNIAKQLKHTGLCIIHVHDMIESLKSIEEMLAFHPVSLEMIDDHILEMGKLSPTVKNKLGWLLDNPQTVFVAEFTGDSFSEVNNKLLCFKNRMASTSIGYAFTVLNDPEQMKHVWEIRKAGLGLLLSKRSYNRAIAFIEDLSVEPKHLSSFIKRLKHYLKDMGKDVGIYGHIGSGCMHIRPFIDLRNPDDVTQLKQIMHDVADMVLDFSGALSGEHGDGFIRSWLNKKMFGNEIYQAFIELKTAFDPHNLMNPDKIVHAKDLPSDLFRLTPETKQVKINTFLDFSFEGGFELAADMCNGNGQCRKREGVMCPSFQATNNEYDTTRARAQSLRSIINGKLPQKEFTGKALYDVLDLCLECKGCKTECPSQVDMAKMKSEFLYQYQQKHGYSLRNRLFGHLAAINKITSSLATSFNVVSSSRIFKFFAKCLGIAPQRDLPRLAKQRFSTWFKEQHQNELPKKVVLFNDTYTEYNRPEIGKAAFKVLTKLGYEVILVSELCCGRPLISKGFLKEAQAHAIDVINRLKPYASSEVLIICLEPSCLSALSDDYKGLIGTDHPMIFNDLLLINKAVVSFEDFLSRLIVNDRLPLTFKENKHHILVHGHCHQKALAGMQTMLKVLRAIPGFTVEEIQSGCCGMAGAFGYEKEHYEISMKIGNLHLLPAVRMASKDTIFIANGISCRSQIEHGTHREALHIAEVVADCLIL